MSAQLTELFLKPAAAWPEVLNSLDLPLDYYITFGAFISTCVSLIFPWIVAEWVMTQAADKFLTPKDRDFIVKDYLPALHEGLEGVTISKADKYKIT